MKRGFIILFLFGIVLAITVPQSEALGLSSSHLKVHVNYIPGFENTYSYGVIPDNSEPMDIELYVSDSTNDGTTHNMGQYFTFEPTIIKDVKFGDQASFNAHLKLPQEPPEPGLHKLLVGAQESIPKGKGSGFNIRTAVNAIFFIHVPFDGIYLKWSVVAPNVNHKEPIPALISAINLGTETIHELFADLVLLDENGNGVYTTQTETISLESNQNKILDVEIPTDAIPPGLYTLETTVHFDGRKEAKVNNVKIGQLNFVIINQTETVLAGKINEVFVTVESEWANDVEKVFAKMIIREGLNEHHIKTLHEDFKGFEQKRLKAFLDAKNINPGIYDMTIYLHYEGEVIAKKAKLHIVKESVLQKARNMSVTSILFGVIFILLVIINLVLLTVLVKKKEHREEE